MSTKKKKTASKKKAVKKQNKAASKSNTPPPAPPRPTAPASTGKIRVFMRACAQYGDRGFDMGKWYSVDKATFVAIRGSCITEAESKENES